MEQGLLSYDYLFAGGPNYIYTLKTRFEAEYEIKFKPGGYLVDNPDFEMLVFELWLLY